MRQRNREISLGDRGLAGGRPAPGSRGPQRALSLPPALFGALLLSLMMVNVQQVSAGPPFVTDDPGTPPLHGWEINISVIAERDSGDDELELPMFDLNYGLRSNVQLKLEFAHLSVRPRDGTDTHGISDTSVGVKWRFLEEDEAGLQMAIYPQVVLPTGSSDDDLGAGRPAYLFPLIAQKSFGEWTAYGDVGLVAQTHNASRDYWFYGVALQRAVTDRLELAAEVFGNSPQDLEDRSSAGFNVGGIWEVADGLGVLLSAGHAFGGGPDVIVYVGLQILTGEGGASPE